MASELGSNRVEALCGNCQEGTDHQVLRERSVGDGTDPVSYTHLTLPTTPYV